LERARAESCPSQLFHHRWRFARVHRSARAWSPKGAMNPTAHSSRAGRQNTNARRAFEERLTSAKRLRAVEDARFRARQAQGKLRRFVTINFRKEEVIAKLALRRGDCNRCGACCEILFKCPFLKKHGDGTSTCGIYEDRPNQCRLFPLEQRDLQEVRGTCSYYFIEKPIKLERAS
jgi:hypothetical protein